MPPNRGLWKGRAEESISVTVKVEPVDRVPLEWNEWNPPAFRPFDRMNGPANARPGNGRARWTRAPYPNQKSPRASLHQQQGEQQ